MAQPVLSQLAANLESGQGVPVRQGPRPDPGRTAVALSSAPARWPGLIMAVDRVDPLQVAVTIRIPDPAGMHSEHIRTLACFPRLTCWTPPTDVHRCPHASTRRAAS